MVPFLADIYCDAIKALLHTVEYAVFPSLLPSSPSLLSPRVLSCSVISSVLSLTLFLVVLDDKIEVALHDKLDANGASDI